MRRGRGTRTPPTENYEGSAVGSDLQRWTFSESVTHDHFFGDGPSSMQAGADALTGTVHSVTAPSPVPLSLSWVWSYTVSGGQGAYAGCTGTGSPVRQSVVLPLVPSPNGTVVESISFDLTCPERAARRGVAVLARRPRDKSPYLPAVAGSRC